MNREINLYWYLEKLVILMFYRTTVKANNVGDDGTESFATILPATFIYLVR